MPDRSRSKSKLRASAEQQATSVTKAKKKNPSRCGLQVWHCLIVYVLVTTGVPVHFHRKRHGFNATQAALAFFTMLNALICVWEIALFVYRDKIQREFKQLEKEFGTNRWGAAIAFFMMEVTLGEVFTLSTWTNVWSTYSLYDPSYSNPESFGFWIDSGNGVSMLVPSLILTTAMTVDIGLSARSLGIMGLIMNYQMWYGTVVYFSTFFCNKRHVGKSTLEVALFVGFSNGLWFFFPMLGMYASVLLIQTNTLSVFGHRELN